MATPLVYQIATRWRQQFARYTDFNGPESMEYLYVLPNPLKIAFLDVSDYFKDTAKTIHFTKTIVFSKRKKTKKKKILPRSHVGNLWKRRWLISSRFRWAIKSQFYTGRGVGGRGCGGLKQQKRKRRASSLIALLDEPGETILAKARAVILWGL